MEKDKAIIYIRHSSIEQAEAANSKYQEKVIRDWCQANRIEVDSVFSEICSSKLPLVDRVEYTKMLQHIDQHQESIKHVFVLRWDRLSNADDTFSQVRKLMAIGIRINAIEQPLDLLIPENRRVLNALCR